MCSIMQPKGATKWETTNDIIIYVKGNFYSFSSFSLQNAHHESLYTTMMINQAIKTNHAKMSAIIQIIRLEVLFFISNLIQHFFISKKNWFWVFFFTQNMLINRYFVIVYYIHSPFLHKLCFNPSQCANICFFTTTIYGPGVRYTSLLLVAQIIITLWRIPLHWQQDQRLIIWEMK